MDRYGIIYGTNRAGAFGYQATSPGLKDYLRKIGSKNNSLTVDHVFEYLAGFSKQSRYAEAGGENPPVAVRYAPLYLRKLQTMPADIEPFNVITISGIEYRDSNDGIDQRETVYSHAILIDRNLLLQRDENNLCYLDQIFGTHLTNWREVRDLRQKKAEFPLDAPPTPVVPLLHPQDKRIVLQAAEAVYAGKSVVIRVDDETNFNDRSISLLTQIYSLIQPRLAAEVGFATYANVPEILKLQEQTSIHIFLVPQECQAAALPSDFLFIDAAEPIAYTSENEQLSQALLAWYNLEWKKRAEAMAGLFLQPELEGKYLKPDIFVETTKNFFQSPFFAWVKSTEDDGKVTSLRQLRQLHERYTLCLSVPWCSTLFEKKIPSLLSPETKLSTLIAQAIYEARSMEARGESIPAEVKENFFYARSLKGLTDYSKDYYQLVSENSNRILQQELTDRAADHDRKINEKDREIAGKDRVIQDLREQMRKDKEDAEEEKNRALEAAENEYKKIIKTVRDEKATALNDQKDIFDKEQRKAYEDLFNEMINVLGYDPWKYRSDGLQDKEKITRLLKDVKQNTVDLEKEKNRLDGENSDFKIKIGILEKKLEKKKPRHGKNSGNDEDGYDPPPKPRSVFSKNLSGFVKLILGLSLLALAAVVVVIILSSRNKGPKPPTTEPYVSTPVPTAESPVQHDSTQSASTTEPTPAQVDVSSLSSLVEDADRIDLSGFTWNSEVNLRAAVRNAKEALEWVPPQGDNVEAAFDELKNALDNPQQMNWQETFAHVPEIQSYQVGDFAAYAPVQSDDIHVVTVISTDFDFDFDGSAGNDTEPPAENRPNIGGEGNQKNYAVIVQGHLTEETAMQSSDAALILHVGKWTAFCFGGEDMMCATIKAMNYAAPLTDDAAFSRTVETHAYASRYLLIREDSEKRFIPLIDLEKEPEWWRNISEFSKDPKNLQDLKKKLRDSYNLNQERTLIYVAYSSEYDAVIIDYSKNQEMILESLKIFNEDKTHSWQSGNYVVVLFPNQNRHNENSVN